MLNAQNFEEDFYFSQESMAVQRHHDHGNAYTRKHWDLVTVSEG